MSCFVPEKRDLRAGLLLLFHWKKTAAESHRILVEAYGEHALQERMCRKWFQRFKSGDFDLNDKERGKPPKKFEDTELQALLDADDAQSQQQLADSLNVCQQTISNRLNKMGRCRRK